MHTDKLTTSLLGAIAIALWMIAMNPWLQPMPVAAQERVDLSSVESYLANIDSNVSRISRGTCTNDKLC
jgi:hypothetical protein